MKKRRHRVLVKTLRLQQVASALNLADFILGTFFDLLIRIVAALAPLLLLSCVPLLTASWLIQRSTTTSELSSLSLKFQEAKISNLKSQITKLK